MLIMNHSSFNYTYEGECKKIIESFKITNKFFIDENKLIIKRTKQNNDRFDPWHYYPIRFICSDDNINIDSHYYLAGDCMDGTCILKQIKK